MNLKQIVNIMPDDKFVDYYIEMSEKFIPGLSSYLVLANTPKLKHIKSVNLNISVLKKGHFDFREISEKYSNNSIFIFHSFNVSELKFIESLPKKIKKIWIFWGFEGYAAFPKTQFLGWKSNLSMYPNSLKGLIQFAASRMKGGFVTQNNILHRRIIKNMDYCATWVEEDFKLSKKINPSLKHLYFCYYSQELMDFPNGKIEKNNLNKLFLGNSGTPTNNHVEALRFLKENKYSGEIYCPLSYGGGKQYVDNILKLGFELFGKRFKPIRDFLPLDEYQRIIAECGIIWMNHKRQQAAGNLFVAFYTGKIVILHPANPLRVSFLDWKLIFYSKDILKEKNKLPLFPLKENKLKIENKLTVEENKSFFYIIMKML